MIKKALFIILLLSSSADLVWAITPIQSLAARIVPAYSNRIDFEKINSKKDAFSIESKNGRLVISGNNYNSMAVGLNHYLKYYCNTSVSWYKADKIDVPAEMPTVPTKIFQEARVPNRFFLNYCTFGYTMPWWKWDDWERLIDWMALNGITMP